MDAGAGLFYLATPYSKYPAGIEQAFRDAAVLAARCLVAGIRVYSPIVHTHPIATYGALDPLSHDTWLPFDEAMMRVADALLVAQMVSWDSSRGIRHEVEFFRRADKSVMYLNPATLRTRSTPWSQLDLDN